MRPKNINTAAPDYGGTMFGYGVSEKETKSLKRRVTLGAQFLRALLHKITTGALRVETLAEQGDDIENAWRSLEDLQNLSKTCETSVQGDLRHFEDAALTARVFANDRDNDDVDDDVNCEEFGMAPIAGYRKIIENILARAKLNADLIEQENERTAALLDFVQMLTVDDNNGTGRMEDSGYEADDSDSTDTDCDGELAANHGRW